VILATAVDVVQTKILIFVSAISITDKSILVLYTKKIVLKYYSRSL